MRAAPWVMCCWPGLPRLWWSGERSSLAVALGFGAVVNLLLVSVTARHDWLSWPIDLMAWAAVGGVWAVATVRAFRQWPDLLQRPVSDAHQGLFLKAQGQYLQGHWYEAEEALRPLVRHSHPDIEASLLLATLYRRTKRWDEAENELGRLRQLDGAEKWQSEVAAEQRMLARLRQTASEPTSLPGHDSSPGRGSQEPDRRT